MIQFGVAGNPDGFYKAENQASEQMPKYLHEIGLDAYEYQCSRGVRIGEDKAKKIKEESEKYGIGLSVHAPYYISLSSPEPEKLEKSIQYITDTMRAAKLMGATKIVVHAGALLGLERRIAVQNACDLLKKALEEAEKLEVADITICPETMGKINQLGNSEEIIQMCKQDKRFLPTIDFGHLYCRELGRLQTKEDWIKELSKYIEVLGMERMKHFHSHFSKMEYTAGGEKRHVTFEEEGYGPDVQAVLEAIYELKLEPTIICESAGTQDIDSSIMKKIYNRIEKD